MNHSYEEIGQLCVTFPAEGCTAGQVCTMGADGKVTASADGDRICGLVCSTGKEQASVQIGGFIRVPCSGTLPGAGWVNLKADGKGGVKKDAAGAAYLAVRADEGDSSLTLYL